MIVITLSKVPPSLRGDLTKWYQEVQTGVYVGQVSARIRDLLWERILRDIGNGEATMVFNAHNELGYQFRTTRTDREVVVMDGLPMMKHLKDSPAPIKLGFSTAAKRHQAHVFSAQRKTSAHPTVSAFVVVDIETTGLNVTSDDIIAIGAVRTGTGEELTTFDRLIAIKRDLPGQIVSLTGITEQMLKAEGVPLADALKEFQNFVSDLPILGYNLRFDDQFISAGLKKTGLPALSNKMIDLMPKIKRLQPFLKDFHLATVLGKYGIVNERPHRALNDAQSTLKLVLKLIEEQKFRI